MTRNDNGQTREEALAQAYRAIDYWVSRGWVTQERAEAGRQAARAANEKEFGA